MEMKHLFRAAALAATMLTAAACIYPFSPELQHGGELPLVVEGDIFLGTYTTLTLSHVRPFGEENAQEPDPVLARGYIFATYCYGSTYPDVTGDGTHGCFERDMSGESIWRMFPEVREAHPLAHGAWAWGTMRAAHSGNGWVRPASGCGGEGVGP